MKENVGRAICWDLDETVGKFSALRYNLRGEADTEEAREYREQIPVGLRYGIRDLLIELSDAGYSHYITTSSNRPYVVAALEHTNLTSHFRRVFTGKEIGSQWGKLYRPVIEDLGFSDEEAISRMIVVGDAPGDMPTDINGLVFLQMAAGHETDALVIREVLVKLLEEGEGDFAKGFNKMYGKDERVLSLDPKSYKSGKSPHKRNYTKIDLENGIHLTLEYESNPANQGNESLVMPIVYIDAPEYERPLEVI